MLFLEYYHAKKRNSEYQNSLVTFECDLLLRRISLQGVFAFIAILVLTKTSYMLLTIRCMHREYSAFQNTNGKMGILNFISKHNVATDILFVS